MNEATLNNKKFVAPSSWNELNDKGIIAVAKSLCHQEGKSTEARVQLAKELFGIPEKLFSQLNPAQKVHLSMLFDWVGLDNNLTKWPLTSIKQGSKVYYGPADKLQDLSGDEFRYCEAVLAKYFSSKNVNDLADLTAILYRPAASFSFTRQDVTERQKFNIKNSNRRSVSFCRLPEYINYAVLLCYLGNRSLIIKSHPNVFSGGDGNEKKTWTDVLLNISGTKFGDYDKTITQNIWLLLRDLDNTIAATKK